MHRHGYQGRKFNRERDQRSALMKGLADSLIRDESIQTTYPKAKEIVPYVEKLVTKAKIGDLHNRRQILSSLQTVTSAHKLVDELAPKMKSRSSGHLRVEKTVLRRGDNAQMARVSFIIDSTDTPVQTAPSPVAAAAQAPAIAPVKKATTTTKKAAPKKATS
jgi:large subunit ribosomal protein L17